MKEESDQTLIKNALAGDKAALETLIKKYQDYIYNLSISFVGDRDEALDLSQEVLIKAVTKLSTFNFESKFSTWLYRILKNHFLNMQRGKFETPDASFDYFGKALDSAPNEILNHQTYGVEEKLLVKEAKISCMKGMLLCLDREQRLIYLLGELFEFPDNIGSEIMDISKENYRVKLHRARKQLYSFMHDKCGLVNKKNPCRCARKTASFIKAGFVNPDSLHFQTDAIGEIMDNIETRLDTYANEIETEYQKLYQSHPFLHNPEAILSINNLLASKEVQETFNFKN